jgi:hypothetical protein
MIGIDTTEIPSGMQSQRWFIEVKANFESFLSKPENQHSICVHEGAHAVFLSRAGGTQITFSGPRMFIKEGVIISHSAETKAASVDRNWLSKITVAQGVTAQGQIHAAGSAAVEELCKCSYYGDSEDVELFYAWYERMHMKYSFSDSKEAAWIKIRNSVKDILRLDLQIKSSVLAVADEVQKLLFPSDEAQ